MEVRAHEEVVTDRPGIDWDRLEDCEYFCRANIPNMPEEHPVRVDFDDGHLSTGSVAEVWGHSDSGRPHSVNLGFCRPLWPPSHTYVRAAMFAGESQLEFEGLNETEVLGLGAAWESVWRRRRPPTLYTTALRTQTNRTPLRSSDAGTIRSLRLSRGCGTVS